MARGKSGRVVIETDPALKGRLYVVLSKRGTTMKEWFEEKAVEAVKKTEGQRSARRARHGTR